MFNLFMLSYKVTLPTPATTLMAGIIDLYESFIIYLIAILCIVTYFLTISVLFYKQTQNCRPSIFVNNLYLEF